MIIEQFYKKPTRTFTVNGLILRDYGFFMEFISREREYDICDVIFIVIKWLIRNGFEKDDPHYPYDRDRCHFDWNDEFETFYIAFRDEEDAMLFKLNPPDFDEIIWSDGRDYGASD